VADRVVQFSVVVPLYNEELVLRESYKRLVRVMDSTKEPYEIIFVDDGSRDKTREIVRDLLPERPEY